MSEWISVKDRLPIPQTINRRGFYAGYLVCDKYGSQFVCRYTGEYWVLWGAGTVKADIVSWRDLPEPPKGETK